jgi:arylsulfatase
MSFRPDLVLILTDQQRFDQVGYESGGYYATPNIDSLAEHGVVFTNAYSGSTTCVPARASLLTGLQHHRVPTQVNRLALREGFWTVARCLREVGYETALIGKMHFAPIRAQHGFETMRLCEHLSATDLRAAAGSSSDAIDHYHDWLTTQGLPDWRDESLPVPAGSGSEAAKSRFPYAERYHPTAWVESEVTSLLEKRDASRPLFLVVSFPHPHAPYNPPEPYASMYDPEDVDLPSAGFEVNQRLPKPFLDAMTVGVGPFAPYRVGHGTLLAKQWLTDVRALITQIDDSIGRILRRIDLSRSVAFFTSDHGDYAGHRGMLKKVPWIPFDDLARVPLVLSGYDVKGGRREASLVQNCDFALTCLDYAGVAVRPGIFDTTSLRPHLTDRAQPTDRNRTVLCATSAMWPMVRRDRFKYILDERSGAAVLFDMVADGGETISVLDEPQNKPIADELSRILRQELGRPVPTIRDLPGGGAASFKTKDIHAPIKFTRGIAHGDSQAMESALWLLQHVCAQLGLDDLANIEMLDFGCGVKFTEAFVNCDLPIKRYVGVDVYEAMIMWLREVVDDKRFEYYHLDAHNDRYNPEGQPLSEAMHLPIDGRTFDLITLFSVFTHLRPPDYRAMLKLLRRYARPGTRLIYSLYIDEVTEGGHGLMDTMSRWISDNEATLTGVIADHVDPTTGARRVDPFRDLDPSRPLLWALYSERYARELMEGTGWTVLSLSPPGEFIQHHFLCAPC